MNLTVQKGDFCWQCDKGMGNYNRKEIFSDLERLSFDPSGRAKKTPLRISN